MNVFENMSAQEIESDNEPEYYGPSEEELDEAEKAIQEELESMQRVFDTDDKVAASMAEAKQYREENRILKERVNGLMNEKNAAIRQANHFKRKLAEYEKAGNTNVTLRKHYGVLSDC